MNFIAKAFENITQIAKKVLRNKNILSETKKREVTKRRLEAIEMWFDRTMMRISKSMHTMRKF